MNELISLLIGAIFVNNFVLMRFLGICPFVGVSRATKPAMGMGGAVTLVMFLVTLIAWPVYKFVLVPSFNVTVVSSIIPARRDAWLTYSVFSIITYAASSKLLPFLTLPKIFFLPKVL